MCITIIRNTIDDTVMNIDVSRSNDTMYSPMKDSNGNTERKSPIIACMGRQNAPMIQDVEHNTNDAFPKPMPRNNPTNIPAAASIKSTAGYTITTICS